MPAPQSILELVDRFTEHFSDYKKSYNETQLRRDFLDPFFTALGWDVDNSAGHREKNRDVIHEDQIRIEGKLKAPDYCFRIGGKRKFFLEAKKPSVNIKEDISAAYQLRRYAWSAKLPLSILSDFEEFSIYDTRIKPISTDPASTARIFYCRFDQYDENWEEISSVFSREAVWEGSFDKFAAEDKSKRGTAEVDADFLTTIEGWRTELARNLALRNPELTQRELNFAVQRTIDRVIFLRICEDRGIEDYGKLQRAINTAKVYAELMKVFHEADDRYNSGLFHFRAEDGREDEADMLTPNLVIDDKLLKEIVQSLYQPKCPYEFSVFDADILGQVYEQFLGKVIRLTPGHRAKVEDKPEVKKAGGVYYTPTFIVDYIVRQTVGPLVEGKTPQRIAKLQVLDPACGSGSFLIGAYQFLLDWYHQYYTTNNPKKYAKGKNPKLAAVTGGDWALTTSERKRILLDHIHGVDIDSQAVEVTKLSLLLKVLESEGDLVQMSLGLFDRVLPNLGNNIKCGNSLIGSDFYNQPELSGLGDEELFRINVFDWSGEDGFPDIMNDGGFDVVIGNPPYLRIQGLQENYANQIEYFIKHFETASKRFDFYMLFIEKCYHLLNRKGKLGFICPHKFTTADYASSLRGFLSKNRAIERFISFGHNLVFAKASTYTGILLLSRRATGSLLFAKTPEIRSDQLPALLEQFSSEAEFRELDWKGLGQEPWRLTEGGGLLQKLADGRRTISDAFAEVLVGVQSGIDEVHVMQHVADGSNGLLQLRSERDDAVITIESDAVKPFLLGTDVGRYDQVNPTSWCVYPYQYESGRTRILEEAVLSKEFPLAYQYLKKHQTYLTDIRRRQKTNPIYWYSCHRSRDMSVFERERIVSPEISKGCNFTLAPGGVYHNTQVYSYVPNEDRKENVHYWLGLLNSRVLWWYLTQTGTVLRGGYFRFKTNYLRPFPIPEINPKSKSDQAVHDRIVALVEKILILHQQRKAANTPQEQIALDRQIAATDKQIDTQVYSLYGLTDDEIKIVEGDAPNGGGLANGEFATLAKGVKPKMLSWPKDLRSQTEIVRSLMEEIGDDPKPIAARFKGFKWFGGHTKEIAEIINMLRD